MQPTFLPWLGYFSLIDSVDKFVFLDVVQFESRSWQQRNRILINNEARWLTVPTNLPFGRSTLINQVLINKEHYSGISILKTLKQAYGNKPGFEYIEMSLFQGILSPPDQLSLLNVGLITEIAQSLGCKAIFISASELNVSGSKADLLLNISKTLGATTYVSPLGSRVYLDEYSGFSDSGISLEYQDFSHPTYPQGQNEFISHLSIIDAICNTNLEATRDLIRERSKSK
jgi:hypothetical protein